jgi:DNA polymerase elongation subunit (family B)
MTEPILKKKVIPKSVKKPLFPSFRLFDFQTFDYTPNSSSANSSEKSNNSNKHNVSRRDNIPHKKKQSIFCIEMFGINEKGETCAITVDDFNPFFFIKVGDDWTEKNRVAFIKFLQGVLKRDANGILDSFLVDYNKLYGFSSGKKSKFLQIVFQNTIILNKIRNLWYTNDAIYSQRKFQALVFQGTTLELYESKIPPLLRYFHIHNICPTGWVEIQSFPKEDDGDLKTTCKYEFECLKIDIKPLLQKETPVPFKICSFDIEASSSHGDFPVPIKNYKRLATQMVDIFLQRDIREIEPAKKMVENVIKKAFNLTKMEMSTIDFVFPKSSAASDKTSIISNIIDLFEKPVEMVKTQASEGKKIMTISSMFEKIAENAKQIQTVPEREGEGDSDEDDAEPTESNNFYTKKKVNFKADRTATIIDVLIDSMYTRDAKIQLVNQALTCVLPPLEGDKVTFIGCTFIRYGEAEPYKNHCLVLGTCDQVEGAEIVSVSSERELLMEWADVIQKEDPDIIIGYNIFGFDYEFMFRRSQETNCVNTFLQLSRKIDEICVKKTRDGEESLENTKTRLASGEYDLRYPSISGRLQIDLLFYFRRDYNFASYKLDDVAGSIIADKIKKVESDPKTETTRLYSDNLTGLHVQDYIHLEIVTFTSDYYQDGKKFQVIEIGKDENGGKYVVIPGSYPDLDASIMSLKWCISKDDVTPQDIFRLTNGSAMDRAIVAKYCIQDCNLVQQLFGKTDVLTGYIEMARICNVPMRFLVFRGQGIKLTSYVAKTCREKDTLMPDLEHVENDDGYEGAIVLPPKCAMYMDNPVFCNDYSSLYPSIAKAWNLSPNSKVWTKDYDLDGNIIADTGEKDAKTGEYIYDNLPEYQYIETEFDMYQTVVADPTKKVSKKIKKKIGKRVCRWAQFPNGSSFY